MTSVDHEEVRMTSVDHEEVRMTSVDHEEVRMTSVCTLVVVMQWLSDVCVYNVFLNKTRRSGTTSEGGHSTSVELLHSSLCADTCAAPGASGHPPPQRPLHTPPAHTCTPPAHTLAGASGHSPPQRPARRPWSAHYKLRVTQEEGVLVFPGSGGSLQRESNLDGLEQRKGGCCVCVCACAYVCVCVCVCVHVRVCVNTSSVCKGEGVLWRQHLKAPHC